MLTFAPKAWIGLQTIVLSIFLSANSLFGQQIQISENSSKHLTNNMLTFAVQTTDMQAGEQLIWNFGDDCGINPAYNPENCNIIATCNQKITHTYLNPGKYLITVKSADKHLLIASKWITISKPKQTSHSAMRKNAANADSASFVNNFSFENSTACPSRLGQIFLADCRCLKLLDRF